MWIIWYRYVLCTHILFLLNTRFFVVPYIGTERRHVRACIAAHSRKNWRPSEFQSNKNIQLWKWRHIHRTSNTHKNCSLFFLRFRFSFGAAQDIVRRTALYTGIFHSIRLRVFGFFFGVLHFSSHSVALRARNTTRTHKHTDSHYYTHSPNSKQIDSR